MGKIDILINNAGGPPVGSFWSTVHQIGNLQFRTNLLSVVYVFLKLVAPHMKEKNGVELFRLHQQLQKNHHL